MIIRIPHLCRVKSVPLHVKQAQRWVTGVAQPIPDPSNKIGWVVNPIPRPLYPREKTRCPLFKRLGGCRDLFGWIGKISLPPGIRALDRPARRCIDYSVLAAIYVCTIHFSIQVILSGGCEHFWYGVYIATKPYGLWCHSLRFST